MVAAFNIEGMMSTISSKFLQFKTWLFGTASLPQQTTSLPIVSDAPKKKRKRAVQDEQPGVDSGNIMTHYTFGNLLENLDDYFEDFRILKRNSPDDAALFGQLGCVVASSVNWIPTELEPVFVKTLPSMGCLFVGRPDKKEDDFEPVRFIFFQKMKNPTNVQTFPGAIYRVGGVFDLDFKVVGEFHVAVRDDGTVVPLKEVHPRSYQVGKGSRKTGGGRKTFYRMEWDYPWTLKEMLRNDKKRAAAKGTAVPTIESVGAFLFTAAVNAVLAAEYGINVRVTKGDRVATFSIDMLRTPYFFADREKTVNQNGNTERILHFVRPHVRELSSGIQKTIKGHWRGIRRFNWNGYDVSVRMPGLHSNAIMVNEFDALAYDLAEQKRLGSEMKFTDNEVFGSLVNDKLTAPRRRAA